jgi:DNA-directed RNA polymerase specialized sigma24 family protein
VDEVYLRTDDAAIAEARVDAMVREYQTKLARYVRRMVGDAEAALDLTQDVFLAAYRMLKGDPQRELTAGWLYRAATNAAISFMRRKKIVRMLPLDREVDRGEWTSAAPRRWICKPRCSGFPQNNRRRCC